MSGDLLIEIGYPKPLCSGDFVRCRSCKPNAYVTKDREIFGGVRIPPRLTFSVIASGAKQSTEVDKVNQILFLEGFICQVWRDSPVTCNFEIASPLRGFAMTNSCNSRFFYIFWDPY